MFVFSIKVLNEVYKYHDPPVDNSIRLPTLMWARVGEKLREYITERQSDSKVFVPVIVQHYDLIVTVSLYCFHG